MIVRVYDCTTMVEEAVACLGYESRPGRLETKMASMVPHALSASHSQDLQVLL